MHGSIIYSNQKREKMELIKSKRVLHGKIRECIDDLKSSDVQFPLEMNFQESMSSPIFKVRIEKKEANFFVDEKGQKWVKADS